MEAEEIRCDEGKGQRCCAAGFENGEKGSQNKNCRRSLETEKIR